MAGRGASMQIKKKFSTRGSCEIERIKVLRLIARTVRELLNESFLMSNRPTSNQLHSSPARWLAAHTAAAWILFTHGAYRSKVRRSD